MSENREIAIQIDGVKKRYKLGTIGGGTLVGDIQSWWARVRHKEDPNQKIGAKTYGKNETFMALDGIDLTIYKGERVGIIGHNGAGKSTLLKLLSRVTGPTEGQIGINGRISSMLEVGTGFNGELTGRENVYINGAILGMTKAEVDAKMDQIIEFSECAQFIDTPVKRYSSGMYVKLAFSVAAHLDSEIMIMDEVLAVGDMKFQQKCLNKMSDVSKTDGRTILYVSHNMNTIRQLCDRCIVLSKGKVIFNGDVEEAIQIYLGKEKKNSHHIDCDKITREPICDGKIHIKTIDIIDRENILIFDDESLKIRVSFFAADDFENMLFRMILFSNQQTPIGMTAIKNGIPVKKGENNWLFEFDLKALAPGEYTTRLVFYEAGEWGVEQLHDVLMDAFSFVKQFKKTVTDTTFKWKWQVWGRTSFPSPEVEVMDENN